MIVSPALLLADGLPQQALFKLNIEQINLSNTEKLSWSGVTYQLEAFPHVFVGGSLYGAMTGERGGFFSLGTEVSLRHMLSDNWLTDVGVYLGGGGGGGANVQVGGGLTFRPHLDVLYNAGAYQWGVSASHVRFPYGTVSSSQLGLSLSHSHDFYDTTSQRNQGLLEQGGLGFDRIRGISAIYHGILRNASDTNESAMMLGVRADQWLTLTSYWSAEIVGAAGGGLGGYADYLTAIGVEYPVISDRFFMGARLGVGMGGGGGALTQGGLLGKLATNVSLMMGKDMALTLEGGYLLAPLGDMQVRYASLELSTDLDKPFADTYKLEEAQYEWQIGMFNYHTVLPNNSHVSIPFSASEVVMNRFFTDYAYYGVHMMYAAKGGKYGGYGAAFVSLGYSLDLWGKMDAAFELSAGGGGGGGTAVGGGALYMGNIYLDYHVTDNVSVRLGVGRMKAWQGALDTTVSEVLLTYRYQVLERR